MYAIRSYYELWGRPSDLPWAMVFANAIQPGGWQSPELRAAWESGALDHLARHPSQLYQALGEGLCLFIVLAVYSRRPRPTAAVSGLFLRITSYNVCYTKLLRIVGW